MRIKAQRTWRRWNDDTFGASMVTTAVTLPVLILVVFTTFHMFRVMLVKWSFDRGVREAARYISEDAAFWEQRFEGAGNLVDEAGMDLGVPPADYYDIEAKRIIVSRLRDVFSYNQVYNVITNTVQVTVTEPFLSEMVESGQVNVTDVITAEQGATMEEICDPPRRFNTDGEGDYRHWDNIRFRVYATMDMPLLWPVKIPWTDPHTVTLQFSNRAIGYVQCARWSGQRDASNTDKTRLYGRQGPALKYRTLSTPGFPTVTATLEPTPTMTTTTATSPPPSATP